MLASVGAPFATETGYAASMIALYPSLQGTRRQLVLIGDLRK